ncbi:MAG: helix-turn-helix domain-containing protein, partial [Bacteroides sp.]|nr:helix-turn-helix domain-containing protein [Bacteroides sp.]
TQVAEILGCTIRTIANYRLSGKLRARVNRHNGRYYYTGEELHRFWRTM